jgi:3'(2'), 5'-bisphosphate nucleotidase
VTTNAREAVDASSRSMERTCRIARRAGAAVMSLYGRVLDVRQKGDQGPVTEADRLAHQIIVNELNAWDPMIPVVSEEADAPGYDIRRRWTRWWLVDPLDGTKEFLAANGEFTINIALMEAGAPVLGAVYAPALQTMYCGGLGIGSWRQRDQEQAAERIYSLPPRRDQTLRVVESRSHRSPELEQYLETLQIVERVQVGSSLKFCRLAEGRADVYPRMTPIMEWDVAAGDCVFRHSAAQGERPSPLRYNRRDLRIPAFVIGLDQPTDQ